VSLLSKRQETHSHEPHYSHMYASWQGVDITVTVCLFVCTVMEFSAENKASGIKFWTAVYWRSRQGISHFGELSSPRSPKSDESPMSPIPWLPSAHIGSGQPWRMRRRRAHEPRIGSACVDIRPSQKTDILVQNFVWYRMMVLVEIGMCMCTFSYRRLVHSSVLTASWFDQWCFLISTM